MFIYPIFCISCALCVSKTGEKREKKLFVCCFFFGPVSCSYVDKWCVNNGFITTALWLRRRGQGQPFSTKKMKGRKGQENCVWNASSFIPIIASQYKSNWYNHLAWPFLWAPNVQETERVLFRLSFIHVSLGGPQIINLCRVCSPLEKKRGKMYVVIGVRFDFPKNTDDEQRWDVLANTMTN